MICIIFDPLKNVDLKENVIARIKTLSAYTSSLIFAKNVNNFEILHKIETHQTNLNKAN